MANFKTHVVAGVTVGVALNLAKQGAQKALAPERKFDWGELLVWGVVGGVAASVPDLLEPATNPNHRSFFHSLALGALILFAIFGKPSKRLEQNLRDLLSLTGFGYLSHLALDIITPMGLPIA
jgi:membrane-bound metal-dependent hydrolase YbcI (DUF457 family)